MWHARSPRMQHGIVPLSLVCESCGITFHCCQNADASIKSFLRRKKKDTALRTMFYIKVCFFWIGDLVTLFLHSIGAITIPLVRYRLMLQHKMCPNKHDEHVIEFKGEYCSWDWLVFGCGRNANDNKNKGLLKKVCNTYGSQINNII